MITLRTIIHRPSKLIYHRVRGFVLPLVLAAIAILMALIIGSTMTSYGSRLQAVQIKAQTEAMLAAEAGYEKAIFWMSEQTDILGEIQAGRGSGSITFDTGSCSYDVSFHDFLGSRPVFRVTSTGISGRPSFTRIVDVDVVQETSGWAMGACRVPYDATTTGAVNFVTGEVINMPLHINNFNDSPDLIDIHISGTPQFKKKVDMGESRKAGATDKYSSVMTLFADGINFEQPNIRITDPAAVQSKVNRFRDSTKPAYKLTPVASTLVTAPRQAAVQLEFYVSANVGYVKITNNCTVRNCALRTSDNYSWDYNMPGTAGNAFKRYNIYGYHYAPDSNAPYPAPLVVPITDTYVSQTFGGYTSEPGGQIYVNGNVIIGGQSTTDPNQVVKGKITVVASGNIWIGDNIIVDGAHDANGVPSEDNPNILGLIAQGVVKVIDPGIANYSDPCNNVNYQIPWQCTNNKIAGAPAQYYQPVGNGVKWSRIRTLPDPTVVEAAITVGSGGWGAENVARRSGSTTYGGRKEFSGTKDNLIVRGSLTECVRGVVGYPAPYEDGYDKYYYIDNRLMSGILPGDIWFSGKYIPAPAGWHDHSPGH
jgi:hypothetical protein